MLDHLHSNIYWNTLCLYSTITDILLHFLFFQLCSSVHPFFFLFIFFFMEDQLILQEEKRFLLLGMQIWDKDEHSEIKFLIWLWED